MGNYGCVKTDKTIRRQISEFGRLVYSRVYVEHCATQPLAEKDNPGDHKPTSEIYPRNTRKPCECT